MSTETPREKQRQRDVIQFSVCALVLILAYFYKTIYLHN